MHQGARTRDLQQAVEWVLHGKVKPSPPASHESADVHVLAQGAGFFFASHQNVLIASWTAQGTGPLIAELAKALGSFIAQHPSGVSNLHIIAAGLPLANAEARDALAALMTAHEGAIACVGTVLDGTGFWASATRGLIMSVQLMAPNTYAVRTCANDAELVGWLPKVHAQRTGINLEAQALERALAEVRMLSAGSSR